jgi:hypothetical protein
MGDAIQGWKGWVDQLENEADKQKIRIGLECRISPGSSKKGLITKWRQDDIRIQQAVNNSKYYLSWCWGTPEAPYGYSHCKIYWQIFGIVSRRQIWSHKLEIFQSQTELYSPCARMDQWELSISKGIFRVFHLYIKSGNNTTTSTSTNRSYNGCSPSVKWTKFHPLLSRKTCLQLNISCHLNDM